jgi:hypothetical protein
MLTEQPALVCAVHQRLGDTNVADNDKRWQDMNPDEQAVLIRQISGGGERATISRPGPRRGHEGLAGEAEKTLIVAH